MLGLAIVPAEQIVAELTALEDRYVWDVPATLQAAERLEAAADRRDEQALLMRARLVRANMMMRSGEVATAAVWMRDVDAWAEENGHPMIRARAQLLLSSVHNLLGDPAAGLEHAVRAVEYLDDTASPHAMVWHRMKLADALATTGSLAAARTRYAQAEEFAAGYGEHRLHLVVLNNRAYSEYNAGEYRRAGQVVRRLLDEVAERGYPLSPAELDTVGNIQIANGLFAEAERTMRDCITLHGEGRHGGRDLLAEYLVTLCRAERGLGAVDRAQATLDAGRAICAERGLNEIQVRVHQEQAELHAARGEFAEAYAAHKEFFAAYERLHSSRREAQARIRQAMFETAEARQEAERFREQARRDPLTGLRNRRYIDERLPVILAETRTPVTVAILDLDHFKRINDELSHDVGDEVLRIVAGVFDASVADLAPDGFAARLGGEEFLLVLPGVTADEAAARLDTVRVRVRGHSWAALTGRPVTVSIGAATVAGGAAETQRGVMSVADANLYEAKHRGRDQVVTGVPGAG